MLTPEYLQGAPTELEALFLRLEEDIIKDICRRIAKVGAISESAEHEILRLKELGAGTDYIKEKIAEYSGLSDEAVDMLFFDAAQSSDEFYSEVYDKANVPYTPYEYNGFFQQAVTAAVNQTKGELRNLTQSMGFSYRGSNGQIRFHKAAEAYRDCLDYAVTQIAAGMADYNTAIRNATRRLTDSGLQFVDYASGVKNHADVAARRAVLTGLSQYTGKIAERNIQELDTDIVEVDAHPGARPDHAEWQGRWYSFSGKSKEYPSLVEVTGYGTVTGLKGANCRHDFYPVIPGISEPSYTEEELKNIDPPPFEYDGKTYTYYEATQRQRYMERSMRKTKRELLAADSTGDKDKFTEKSVLLRRQKEEYGKFSKAAGLLTQNERTQVYGYDRSKSAKTVWAAKKATQNNSGGTAPITPSTSGGHAYTVSVPTPTTKPETVMRNTKPTFVNAESIDEATAYARSLGVEHPDYAKFTLERANNMNMALSTLPDDSMPYVVTDLQKYTAVTGAPLGKSQKNGYACTVTPYEIDLKRAGIADISRTVGSGNTIVAVNTRNYKTIDSITESKAKSEELVVSRNLGKSYHFNTDGKATDFHECGHIYATKHNIPVGFSADADRWYKETGCMMLKTTSEAWSEAYAAYYTHANDLPPYIRRYFDDGEWKVNSGSKVLSLDEWHRKLLTNGGGSGNMKMGKNNTRMKPPDFAKYVVKDDQTSVERARQTLIREFGLSEKDVQLDGIRNAEVLEPFVNRLVEIHKRTGFQLPNIKAMELVDFDACCVADFKPGEKRFYISSKYFNSKEALMDALKDWTSDKNKFFPKQAYSNKLIEYIAEHEAAHIRIPESVIRNEEAIKIWKKRKLINDNDSDIFEFYADVVAIYKTSSKYDKNIQNAIDYLIKEGVKI